MSYSKLSMTAPNKKNTFLITIDVEDWFQVENFKSYIPHTTWDSRNLRVEGNTHKLLDLFDSFGSKAGAKSQKLGKDSRNQGVKGSSETNQTSASEIFYPVKSCSENHHFTRGRRNERSEFNRANSTNKTEPSVRTTFFILGWIAERLPSLVREIHDRGHEVASHGFDHEMCNRQSPSALKADLVKSKQLLEDIIGADVHGYRAPSFSVDKDILKLIEDAGYRYDSSYNSFDKHGRYGKLTTNGFQRTGIAYQISDSFHELPVSNLSIHNSQSKINNYLLPWAGGGYFRLIPHAIFNMGVRSILKKESGYLFYLHPWEIDPLQPRVNQASTFFKFRHYINLHKTEDKLKKMIRKFGYCRFSTCKAYLASAIT